MKKKIFKLAVLSICLLLVVSLSFSAKDTKAPPSKEKETVVTVNQKDLDQKKQTKPETGIVRPTQIPVKDEQPAAETGSTKSDKAQVTSTTLPKSVGMQIKWQTISAGEVRGSSASFKLRGTVGEDLVEKGISSSYRLKSGYWAGVVEFSEATYLKGDANGDGKRTVADVVYLVNYLFKGGPLPVGGLLVGDANCDGKVTVADVVYLINYLFKGGPPPAC